MASFTDPSQFTMTGAYYPKGHVFAMFKDAASAHAAVESVAKQPKVGEVQFLSPEAITQAFAERIESVGGMPSVGREDQFMLRFVELSEGGKAGVLIDMASAVPEQVGAALSAADAILAYYYRALVIEELVDTSARAEAAASGKL